ncbi:MAG: aldose epimerase family protein [Sphingobacterium sp.]
MNTYRLPDSTSFLGKVNQKNTHLITLTNRAGMQIALTDYGARIVSALVPDKRGDLTDVVLGFDSIAGYLQAKESYHGATIGRYGNRIADGKFTLDDIDYTLAQNNGINALHGGVDGFHRQVWDRQVNFNKVVIFYHVSPASAEGFPGELKTTISFELTNDNQIIIKYRATTNAPTIINLTNHAYFNLNGEGSGDILDHDFQIHSEQFLPINENQIPTGEFRPVEGSLFDFRQPTPLKTRLERQDEQLRFANGFDHTFINNQAVHQPIASAYSRKSGIQLDVLTTEPGLHFYSGNFLSDDVGKSGQPYAPHSGFCFESQHHPNSPNQDDFPKVTLRPGEIFESETRYKFTIRKHETNPDPNVKQG